MNEIRSDHFWGRGTKKRRLQYTRWIGTANALTVGRHFTVPFLEWLYFMPDVVTMDVGIATVITETILSIRAATIELHWLCSPMIVVNQRRL
ncbi:BZ3500_MvSof-1268-A1-R1_Chr5-3g08308 [Microbotryum saponariae]|uniref:BZ3500_MvSof-1268-A1-R1_Chr5-3g08308 protein n=1 Tax=Microbotryum saponariae TaxID=289078 RepID=A0A2X0NQ99_9BASI|nr:BZ3500_MvSof-1268-A1-R1_Chr5-3g08308 [Microbotryum saponariae]SDA08416.1 BZ3501_MvSof-1269-A2-R1_Chr5-3g08036 [Microbotryum saponariae]